MKKQQVAPTGRERTFEEDEIIVSKTDLTGRITYANKVFLRVAGYEEHELLGEQHNIIRHPAMPRCVFKYLWDTIEQGQEIFAYVINQCKNGDHYWVFAHVTPTFNAHGEIIGYHSSRRVPDRKAVETIDGIYKLLLAEEERHSDPRKGMESSLQLLVNYLGEHNVAYDEFVFGL
ncbi:MAG: PAS domain-containing protein [Bdellovibrionales bacterium]|nr:PAS domain-containing protein [Bdellovibrionales bacterium]